MPSGVGGERVYGTGEKLSIGIACCSVDWIRGIRQVRSRRTFWSLGRNTSGDCRNIYENECEKEIDTSSKMLWFPWSEAGDVDIACCSFD